MNIAILGYGSIAENHARTILTLQRERVWNELRLYGVAGPSEDSTSEFARKFGLTEAVADPERLLGDPEVDAVVICSPTDLHADQTEQALNAGKHVLCEIPLATSLAETDRLTHLAKNVDRRLMVCHTQRYSPALVEARRMVETGELHPHSVVSRYMFGRRENVNWRGRHRSWTDNLLWHHGCHAVDAALWLLGVADRGEAVETVSQVALPGGNLDIPMDLSLVLRTQRDQIATVVMSYHTHISIHDYLIIGEETTVLFTDGRLRDSERLLVDVPPSEGLETPMARQDAEFFSAIREDREPAVSGRSVRPAMAALQAAQDGLDARIAALGPDARHPREP